MPTWYVQDKDKVKALDEERLRKRLRQGHYTGAERVRPEGATEWRLLYELPLFAEEVPNRGDPLQGARDRVKNAFLQHALSFVGVVGVMTLMGGFPNWAMWWGIGLIIHAGNTLMRLNELRSLPAPPVALPAPVATPVPQPTPVAPPVATPAVAQSPWRASVEASLVAIEQRAATSGQAAALPDMSALRRTADELDQGARELLAATNPDELARLELDLNEAEGLAQSASDARNAEAQRRAATAIRERLAQSGALRDTLQRVQARQAALLHQIEALRLAMTTAQLGGSGGELDDELAELRQAQRADDEVERELAAARQRVAASRGRVQ